MDGERISEAALGLARVLGEGAEHCQVTEPQSRWQGFGHAGSCFPAE